MIKKKKIGGRCDFFFDKKPPHRSKKDANYADVCFKRELGGGVGKKRGGGSKGDCPGVRRSKRASRDTSEVSLQFRHRGKGSTRRCPALGKDKRVPGSTTLWGE